MAIIYSPTSAAWHDPEWIAKLDTGDPNALNAGFCWASSSSGHNYWSGVWYEHKTKGARLTAKQIERAKIEAALIAMGVVNEYR